VQNEAEYIKIIRLNVLKILLKNSEKVTL